MPRQAAGGSKFCSAARESPVRSTTELHFRGQSPYTLGRGCVAMWRTLILAAGLIACVIPACTSAQEKAKTVTLEVYQPEGTRLFIEGREASFEGTMHRFVSPPLPPGKYTYNIRAI